MATTLVGAVANIALDPLFIFVFDMNVTGAALATVISLTRKLVLYLGATLLLPEFFGVQAVFYAEPVADIGGALLSTTVFLIFFPKILKKRAAIKSEALGAA